MVDCYSRCISTDRQMTTSFQDVIGNNVQLILIPSSTFIQDPSSQKRVEVMTTSDDPLDLSYKPTGHDLLRRSSSSSSASSSDSGFLSCASSEVLLLQGGSTGDVTCGTDINEAGLPEEQIEDRRLKRREQNKAAAQAYRQRKKSFSDLVETEYDVLLKRNSELLGRKAKLENQILKIRQLLDHVVQASKQEEEQQQQHHPAEVMPVDEQHVRVKSESSADLPIFTSGGLSITIVRTTPETAETGFEPDCMKESGRSRQYSWPSDGSTCPVNSSRKKEQNRIASQRFRERRRMAMSRCQAEADFYEASNVQLRQRCDHLQRKIDALKKFFQTRNLEIPTNDF